MTHGILYLMETLDIKTWMLKDAIKKSKELGVLNNSITSGKGNRAGYLSEAAIASHVGADVVSCDEGYKKYNHDLEFNGKTIEVKTKRRTVDPRLNYEVSIAKTSLHQKPEIYAFASITYGSKSGSGVNVKYKNLKKLWLCGFISSKEFFEKAKFVDKGDVDPSNGFRCHVPMWNLPISLLYKGINF
jgi:hypothetical protein